MSLKSIFKTRQKRLQKKLAELGVEGFICEMPVDIFYLTGMKLSKGFLWITKRSLQLFVDGRYLEAAKVQSACSVSFLSDKQILSFCSSFVEEGYLLGFDRQTPYANYLALKKLSLQLQQKRGARFHLKGLMAPIQGVRAIKDGDELELIKKSSALLVEGFVYLKKQLKEGVEEREIAWQFESFCRSKGAEGLSFPPIVAFGENSALPHHISGEKRLKKGMIVLLDLGVILNGYCSDMTRVIFFGNVSKELQTIFALVKKAHQAALDRCQPGVSLAELDQTARSVIASEGYEKAFVHSLGHGVGLEIHEKPEVSSRNKKEVLIPGMVLTIEPGIYLPGQGGVRYEDMVVVTQKGCQNLFESLNHVEHCNLLN